ncbi:uncharacterized protein LOC116575703 [Mustela erminea]|uniref:uncharacterized protein LOC116575703 n=1 Tax=Mustela erminea TaxID=36723 RepID=UPI001386C486|nr:uncharacterized protein LOC116575703 [Mustela erminea]
MTEQRDGWPSQSWSRCSTCSPNKHALVQGQRGGGCWLPGPPGTLAPLLLRTGRAAWLRLPGQRLLVGWGMMAAAPPCCPAWEEECRARSWRANGRSGAHPYQPFGAKKEEVIGRLPRRLASRGPPCPVNRLVEWLPSLSFEACVSSWGPPGMADGCGDMDPRCRSERIHGNIICCPGEHDVAYPIKHRTCCQVTSAAGHISHLPAPFSCGRQGCSKARAGK